MFNTTLENELTTALQGHELLPNSPPDEMVAAIRAIPPDEKPPTEPQRRCIERSTYDGPPPRTLAEAGAIIGVIKMGYRGPWPKTYQEMVALARGLRIGQVRFAREHEFKAAVRPFIPDATLPPLPLMPVDSVFGVGIVPGTDQDLALALRGIDHDQNLQGELVVVEGHDGECRLWSRRPTSLTAIRGRNSAWAVTAEYVPRYDGPEYLWVVMPPGRRLEWTEKRERRERFRRWD